MLVLAASKLAILAICIFLSQKIRVFFLILTPFATYIQPFSYDRPAQKLLYMRYLIRSFDPLLFPFCFALPTAPFRYVLAYGHSALLKANIQFLLNKRVQL